MDLFGYVDTAEELKLLQYLEENTGRRLIRLTDFLTSPEKPFTEGWHFCLPRCFYSALNIGKTPKIIEGRKKLVWTQGNRFSFSQGDFIYDTKLAYQKWNDALKHVTDAVKVIEARPVEKEEHGSVIVDHLKNAGGLQLVKSGRLQFPTQAKFVRFLITGSADEAI